MGFCVARSTGLGNAKASKSGTGDGTDSHVFFIATHKDAPGETRRPPNTAAMPIINIGRQDTNDCVVKDDTVSRTHARLSVQSDGTITVRDLNSTHGTFVNDRRITGDTPLKPGDTLKLGRTAFDWEAAIRRGANGGVPKASPQPKPTDIVNCKSIGRSPSCDIVLDYPAVSGVHAYIGLNVAGQPVIQDNGSRNGTFVNGQKITGRRVLNQDDSVSACNKYPIKIPAPKVVVDPVTPKPNHGIIYAVVAVAAAIIIGIVVWKWVWPKTMEPSEIYARYKNSVVLICNEYGYCPTINGRALSAYSSDLAQLDCVHLDEDDDLVPGSTMSCGTGFFVSEDGRIMTNRHVIDPSDKAEQDKVLGKLQDGFTSLYRQTGERLYLQIAQSIKVEPRLIWTGVVRNDTHVNLSSKADFISCTPIKISTDENVDIAIIQTNDKRTPTGTVIVNLNDISKPEDREPGDKVYTIGFPQAFNIGDTEIGLEANNQSGEITQERGEYTYGHNITIHRGASGSPVFDCNGRFAGIIVSGYLGLSQGYNHSIQPERAAEMMH